MPQLIGALLIIALAILVIYVAVFVALSIIVIPVWLLGLVLAEAMLQFRAASLTAPAKLPEIFSDVADIVIENQDVRCEIGQSSLRRWTNPNEFDIGYGTLATVIALVTFVLLYNTDLSQLYLAEFYTSHNELLWGGLSAIVATPFFCSLLKPGERLSKSVGRSVERHVQRVSDELQHTEQLRELVSESQRIAWEIDVEPPADQLSALREHLLVHTEMYLEDPKELRGLIRELTDQAHEDRTELLFAEGRVKKLLRGYHDVSTRVHRSGSPSLIKRVDDWWDGFQNLKALLSEREWEAFRSYSEEAQQDLGEISSAVEALSDGERRSRSPSDPYDVLGVPADLPFDQVKKVKRRLAQIYHPDGLLPDNERIRQINHAFDQIKALEAKKQASKDAHGTK